MASDLSPILSSTVYYDVYDRYVYNMALHPPTYQDRFLQNHNITPHSGL